MWRILGVDDMLGWVHRISPLSTLRILVLGSVMCDALNELFGLKNTTFFFFLHLGDLKKGMTASSLPPDPFFFTPTPNPGNLPPAPLPLNPPSTRIIPKKKKKKTLNASFKVQLSKPQSNHPTGLVVQSSAVAGNGPFRELPSEILPSSTRRPGLQINPLARNICKVHLKAWFSHGTLESSRL